MDINLDEFIEYGLLKSNPVADEIVENYLQSDTSQPYSTKNNLYLSNLLNNYFLKQMSYLNYLFFSEFSHLSNFSNINMNSYVDGHRKSIYKSFCVDIIAALSRKGFKKWPITVFVIKSDELLYQFDLEISQIKFKLFDLDIDSKIQSWALCENSTSLIRTSI
jgi:hypothetical protein